MSIEQLEETAQAMVAAGKGIIAIDESNSTIKKRFDGVGIDCSEENRRAYREMLLSTPNLSDHISGAILYDETLRQSTRAGVPFTKLMLDNGILPGIKVDKGPQGLAGFPGEVVTEGLDGLRERLNEYARPARSSRSGVRSSISVTTCRARPPLMRTHMRWRVTPRSVRKPGSCRWSNRKC